MKAVTKGVTTFIIGITITALLLTGAVPSYALPVAAENQDLQILPAVRIDRDDIPKLHAESALLVDLDSGTALIEKNADKVREPASVTKILTALVALETLDPDQKVTIPEDIEIEGSVIGLVPGEVITVEELLYGMMLESGNDAAEALAIAAAGNIDSFSGMLNERARQCGATHTDYRNPNGLNEDRSRLNWTTTEDLALITEEAMRNETFRKIVSTKKHTIPVTNKSDARKLVNSNLCLWDKRDKISIGGKEVPLKYDGCTGVKTGMTSDAGYCFVGTAERDGASFLAISLGTESDLERFQDAIRLWDFAFANFRTYVALSAGEKAGVQRVSRGAVRKVSVAPEKDLAITVDKDKVEDPGITKEFLLEEEKLAAPVEKGQRVGRILALDPAGRLVGMQDLYTLEAVKRGGPLSVIGIEDREAPWVIGAAAVLLLLLMIIALARRKGRRKVEVRKQEDMRSVLVKMRTAGEGMTPAEWSELTGDPKEMPVSRGPARLTEDEFAEINAPEITRLANRPKAPAPPPAEDPNRPRRHGRLSKEELDALMNDWMKHDGWDGLSNSKPGIPSARRTGGKHRP